jgi:dolichol-phosphate mannosyltransferase
LPREEVEKPTRFKRLSIIIPCYNEVENIGPVLDAVGAVDVLGLEKEIIVVDDGSVDGTMEVLEKVSEKYKGSDVLKIHFSMLNQGKGTAIRIGLVYATGEIILIQDADLEYDPRDYPKLVAPIIEGKADVVYGSRFLGKSGPLKGMVWANYIANKLLAFLATVLYGKRITDEATCYKAFRSDVIKNINLTCQRFEFCPEVTAKVLKKKHDLIEVPISYEGRTTLEGKKITWRDGLQAIWTIIKWRFKR